MLNRAMVTVMTGPGPLEGVPTDQWALSWRGSPILSLSHKTLPSGGLPTEA